MNNCIVKYIFCDYDGVLTSLDEGGSFLTENPQVYAPSDKCIERIKSLCHQTNAKIIISSNWRKFKPDEYWLHNGKKYYNPLPNLYKLLDNLIVGELPPVRHIVKSEALRLFFTENNLNENNCKYVIFDDDLRENYQNTEYKTHFILTDVKSGLTDENVKTAISILNN